MLPWVKQLVYRKKLPILTIRKSRSMIKSKDSSKILFKYFHIKARVLKEVTLIYHIWLARFYYLSQLIILLLSFLQFLLAKPQFNIIYEILPNVMLMSGYVPYYQLDYLCQLVPPAYWSKWTSGYVQEVNCVHFADKLIEHIVDVRGGFRTAAASKME